MDTFKLQDPIFSIIFVWQVIEAGANALVAGSAVFGAKDYAEGIFFLKKKKLFCDTMIWHILIAMHGNSI